MLTLQWLWKAQQKGDIEQEHVSKAILLSECPCVFSYMLCSSNILAFTQTHAPAPQSYQYPHGQVCSI